MMVRITKSIKYSIFLSLLVGTWSAMTSIQAEGEIARLPVLRNIGAIPVQFEGNVDISSEIKEKISDDFYASIDASQRFRPLDRDLVKDLWASTEGRSDLRNNYELDVYLSLAVRQVDDIVTITGRLLDPQLKTLLTENDRIPLRNFGHMEKSDVRNQIESLTFRLLNRLPNDVNVTSLQGPFVTLSGGQAQGIETGDRIEIIRPSVAAIHPANGSWVDFQISKMGSVQIIESKESTSIGRILGQTKSRAIEVGDGAKISTLPSRVRFARATTSSTFEDSGNQDSLVLPPISTLPTAAKVAKTTMEPNSQPPSKDLNRKDPSSPRISEGGKVQEAQTAVSPPLNTSSSTTDTEENPSSAWNNFAQEAMNQKLIEDMRIYVGPTWWKARGPVSSSGAFPIWLLNSIGGGFTRNMFYKIKVGFGGGLLFGQTPAGSYLGYDSHARMFWESPLSNVIMNRWRAGASGSFSGVTVSSGSYGGGDFIRGGIFGGIGGQILAGEAAQPYEWDANLYLHPLNIGRLGYSGSFKNVESAIGWKIDLSVFEKSMTSPLSFGGGLSWTDERQTLKNGRRFHLNDYSVMMLAKYRL
jgi:hypothetical protein